MDLNNLLPRALEAAELACEEILRVYHSDNFEAEAKGDNSPLTLADRKAHERIVGVLQPANIPVLSEEGKSIPYDQRRHWEYFWMVDPLDGTKEFIRRNGEFTVNIALIYQQKPLFGVVAVPVTGEVFYSDGKDAFIKTGDKTMPLLRRPPTNLSAPNLKVVASRSHMNDDTQNFISELTDPELVSRGSSLKFMLVAEGKADVYPRYAPTMEWDTAAAHAIINAVGLKVLEFGKETELRYNKENLLNPYFLVR